MTNSTNLKNLALKMINIMRDVEYIQKTGRNNFHKYTYATEADVAAAFSTAMKSNGVFMFSSITDRECITYKTAGNKDSFLVTVRLEVTFVDSDSGETFTASFFGDGTDAGDKGIYKAITGAQKYALMKTFLLQTGDDPENDGARNQIVERVEYKNDINKLELVESLKKVAALGTDAFREKWASLSTAQKAAAKYSIDEFKSIALNFDNEKNDPEDSVDFLRGSTEDTDSIKSETTNN